jgi:hypothetical protein
MEGMIYAVLGGLLLFGLISALVKAPGQNLNTKFVRLGELKGRRRPEIEAAVGPPNAVSTVAGGKTLCQWMQPGYHIALLFDNDVCEGVTHEVRV